MPAKRKCAARKPTLRCKLCKELRVKRAHHQAALRAVERDLRSLGGLPKKRKT